VESRFSIVIVCAVLAISGVAAAQSTTTGAIKGRVIDAKSKRGLIGVTVIVKSPSLIDPQSAITDEDGVYKITELTPGDYSVTFYDGVGGELVRNDVHVGANDVVPVFQELNGGEQVEVYDRAPQIKMSTDLSIKIDRDFLTKIPLPGRTVESAAGTKAGAHNDGVGIAFSGSTALENRFLVDGIDITGLTFGDVGTPVLNEFVEEIEVLSGGYNAEWGRAIGGIVNVVTKTGSNKFKGSIFGTFSPGYLSAGRETAPVNASSIDVVANRAYSADFGAELGGPILKDRLWFYAGFAPQFSRTDFTRITKRQTDCRKLLPSGELSTCNAKLSSQGGNADGAPDVDPKTGFFITDEVDREVRAGTSRGFSSIGKLNLAVTPKHQAQLSMIAVPAQSRQPGLLGLSSSGGKSSSLSFDTAARWTSKLNDDKTEIEAVFAWHHSTLKTGSIDPTLDNQPRQLLSNGNLGTWTALGGESQKTAIGCSDSAASGDPYPNITNCPMESLSYAIGGPGAIAHDKEDRRSARLAITQRGHFYGGHEIKAGIDVDDNSKETARLFSGGAFLQNFVGPGVIQVTRWVQLAPPDEKDPRFDQICSTPDTGGATMGATKSFSCDFLSGKIGAPGTQVVGQTLDWATFLRDSWQPIPNLTLNAGVRYEEQKLRYATALRNKVDPLTGDRIGTTAMDLTGNFAPRLGVIWDPTEVGKSKIYAAWGRFFEAIPMDINDRSFGGEVSYQQTFNTGPSAQPCGAKDPAIGGPNAVNCLTPSSGPDSERLIGSSGVLVAPGIKAQYLDELVLGAEFQLAPDLKLGLTYQNRSLGRVIEDVSTDGAQTYLIANPGEWSKDDQRALEDRISRTDDVEIRQRLERQLALFKGINRFDRPSRNYSAIEINLSRRFSRGLFVQASYTFSRTEGNYPGSVSYDNGQIDPNISSQYDLIELLSNRRGRLPQDRPHSIKLDGFYTYEIDKNSMTTIGTRIRAVSGIPKNALGAHYLYGPDESFLLPRGQLGRTELEHAIDIHVSYGRRLAHGMTAEVFADIFNLYNRQGVFDVDKTYAPPVRRASASQAGGTANNVNPISGGTYEDLMWAKSIDANGNETSIPTARNPNFGQTINRYAPASAQVGFRLTF
jgi:outer membrane receptor protein involved in Fe transport